MQLKQGYPVKIFLAFRTMKKFTIHQQNDQQKIFLKQDTRSFYYSDYHGGNWRTEGTVENVICTLKNDITPFPEDKLKTAVKRLNNILSNDLPEIHRLTELNNLTVCVVPRAKAENKYQSNQLLFKTTVRDVVNRLNGFSDGTDYIIRHKDTRTTHRDKAGYGGNGALPYSKITKNTCTISNEVKDKNILLIDDLYTKTINIDEDAIQALLDNGAQSVIFYAVGKTVHNEI